MVTTKDKDIASSWEEIAKSQGTNVKKNLVYGDNLYEEKYEQENPLKELLGSGKRKPGVTTEQIIRETRQELGVDKEPWFLRKTTRKKS